MRREVAAQMVITLISPVMTLTIGLGTALILFLGAKFFQLRDWRRPATSPPSRSTWRRS